MAKAEPLVGFGGGARRNSGVLAPLRRANVSFIFGIYIKQYFGVKLLEKSFLEFIKRN